MNNFTAGKNISKFFIYNQSDIKRKHHSGTIKGLLNGNSIIIIQWKVNTGRYKRIIFIDPYNNFSKRKLQALVILKYFFYPFRKVYFIFYMMKGIAAVKKNLVMCQRLNEIVYGLPGNRHFKHQR